ncbi:hypothetical protein [Flexivirga meconopsidis]|uniref:hypothetical protein n=1 Tax=Flexivirga meconopsidis TaxID=2977121 RepID=UPI00223EB4D9|nr:hypothetical protein [Flexivirga meconopsidis]
MTLTLSEFLAQIEAVSGATDVDPDAALVEISDIDSMDMMEWLYSFQSEHPEVGADPDIFENEDGSTTLRIVHDRLVKVAAAAA